MIDFLFAMAWPLGSTLPALAWKILCLHAFTLALLSLTRSQDARLRYALLGFALLASAGTAVIDVTLAWSDMPSSQAGLDAASSGPGHSTWPLWLALSWLAGSLLATLRVVMGLGWLRGLLRTSQAWTDSAWQTRIAEMAGHLRISRKIGLRVVHTLTTPVTAGWLKPVILVPASLATGMPPHLLSALLAHIRRHDYLVNLLQHVAEILLFFHPSVWWLSGRMRIERERIADQMAGAVIGNPRLLAQALHTLKRCTTDAPAPVAPAARDGDLLDRIRRLVRPDTPRGRPAVVLPVATLCFALAGFGAWSAVTAGPARALSAAEARELLARLPGIQALVEASGASHVLLLDSRSGSTLVRRAENEAVPIASLTKLMTAMVVLDAVPDLSRTVRVDERDAIATAAGAPSPLPVGAQVSLDTLLRLALMASDNRAAHALARNYPGGEHAFALALQRKTAALHLEHTTLDEPTGLSSANRASAADIAKILVAAAAYPQIARDTTTVAETIETANNRLSYHNSNPLIGAQGWDIRLSKTGNSSDAGRCLAMRIHIDDRDLTLVLLNGRPART